MGLWQDGRNLHQRAFPPVPNALPGTRLEEGGNYYWSQDVAASVKQLAARIVAEGKKVGYLGLQNPEGGAQGRGVQVFESVGATEHYKRRGHGDGHGGEKTAVRAAGFEGMIVEQGANRSNAVYKITITGRGGGGHEDGLDVLMDSGEAEEDLAALQRMFPRLEPVAIRAVYRGFGGNFETAVEMLTLALAEEREH